MIRKIILSTAFTALMGSAAFAVDCGPSGKSVRILGSDFPAIQAVAGTAESNCSGSAGEFTVNLRDNTRRYDEPSFDTKPCRIYICDRCKLNSYTVNE